eukprot:GEMP01000020.1.p1 GENE.GEMP01000020.1~~GEMP01000020.1.p1  ORF type:complete len:2901 (+),score=711.29 GEMP01000020.1:835-9537(+)
MVSKSRTPWRGLVLTTSRPWPSRARCFSHCPLNATLEAGGRVKTSRIRKGDLRGHPKTVRGSCFIISAALRVLSRMPRVVLPCCPREDNEVRTIPFSIHPVAAAEDDRLYCGNGEPRFDAVELYFESFMTASIDEGSFRCSADAAQSLLYQWDKSSRRPPLPATTRLATMSPFQVLFVLTAIYCKIEPYPRDIPADSVLRALPTTITHEYVLRKARESVQALCHASGLDAVLSTVTLPWVDPSMLIGGQRGVTASAFTPAIATFLLRAENNDNGHRREVVVTVFVRAIATLSDLAALFTQMALVAVDVADGDEDVRDALGQQVVECQVMPAALKRIQVAVLGLAKMQSAHEMLLVLPPRWQALLPMDAFYQLLLTSAEKSAAMDEPATEDIEIATKMGGMVLLSFLRALRDEALFVLLLSDHAAQFFDGDLCTLFDVYGKKHHSRDGMAQLASFLRGVPNRPSLHSALADHVAPKVKRMECARMLDNAQVTCRVDDAAVESVLRKCWLENVQWDVTCIEQAMEVAQKLQWSALVVFVLDRLEAYGLAEALAKPFVLLTALDLNVSNRIVESLNREIPQFRTNYLDMCFLVSRNVLSHPDEQILNVFGVVAPGTWPFEEMRRRLARAEKYLEKALQCLTFVKEVEHSKTQEILESLANEKNTFRGVLTGPRSPGMLVPILPYDALKASAFFLTYIRKQLGIKHDDDHDEDNSPALGFFGERSLFSPNRGFLSQLQRYVDNFSIELGKDLRDGALRISDTYVSGFFWSFDQFCVIQIPDDPTTIGVELERAKNIASLQDVSVDLCELLIKAARFETVAHAAAAMTEFVVDFAAECTDIGDTRSKLNTLVPDDAAKNLRLQANVVSEWDAMSIPPELIELVCELADAREFVRLVQEYLDEDLRLLVDNEYKALPVPVVNALLDAQRFLRTLRELPWSKHSPTSAFNDVNALLTTRAENVCILEQLRVGQCSQHALKVCLDNIYDGSNATVKKIGRFVADGVLGVIAESDSAPVAVTAEIDGGAVVAQWAELQDWQRRAYLVDSDDACITFLRIMTHVADLRAHMTDLRRCGHFDYRRVALTFRGSDFGGALECTAEGARNSVAQWAEMVASCHRRWYSLTFFSAEQLWVLYDSLSSVGPPTAPALHLLRYLGQCDDTRVNLSIALLPYELPSGDLLAWLGSRLSAYASHTRDNTTNSTPRYRQVEGDSVPCAAVNALRRSTHPHVICVPPVDTCVCVLLALYYQRGRVPNMEEVLFCRGATTETVMAFVDRALCAPPEHDDFFCLVNIEVLPYTDQVRVGEKLDHAAASMEPSRTVFALCLITEEQNADARSPYLRHKYHHVRVPYKALSVEDASTVLRLGARNPCTVVVSDRAAHGKTYHIHALARSNQKSVFSLHLSGPVDFERSLVQRLQTLSGSANNAVLHVDIGAINAYTHLSDILFTLIVCGGAAAGSNIAIVTNVPLYIEVGNVSAAGDIIQRVPCLRLLHSSTTRVRFSIDDIQISSLPRAPVQVVCGTLRAATSFADRPLVLGQESISAAECRALLKQYVASHWSGSPSYAEVMMHLRVLARELVYFSRSVYLQAATLRASRVPLTIREDTIHCLLQATAQFTRPSLSGSPSVGNEYHGGNLGGMTKWDDAKAMVVFNRMDFSTLTAIFRHPRDLPSNIQRLFTSQGCALPLYDTMSSDELVCSLQRLATRASHTTTAPENYKLTCDNFLKMVWIALKTDADIPVFLCGETGCGKTSLIRCVACIRDIACECLNVHAGTTRESIVDFLDKCISLAAGTQEVVYCFLDEVNTNEDALALVSEMLGGQLHGESLPSTLKLLCAVNPYRRFADSGRLMYHVFPLPDKMLEYVYDFGALGEKEEGEYIRTMVDGALAATTLARRRSSLAVDLIVMAQTFIRKFGNEAVLSLRDVQRCCDLMSWFAKNLEMRERHPSTPQPRRKGKNKKKRNDSKKWIPKDTVPAPQLSSDDRNIRAILNAILICYYCRLSDRVTRKDFRAVVQSTLGNHEIQDYKKPCMGDNGTLFDDGINQLFREEMEAYVGRMVDDDDDIALNEALLENTFVMLVCILTRIPVFVVGHPGCSKSLSLTLIGTHLRGASSADPFFQKMPEVLYVSYQGSEISISEGLIDAFARAERIQAQRPENSRVVVHLDECGLAERSPHNPFKVLHAELESAARCVSVVGLSNDALDASKMNRAVCIQRPLPNKADLCKTAKALDTNGVIPEEYKKAIADAYLSYWKTQERRHADAGGVRLHGMRDFYALVKSLCRDKDNCKVCTEDVYQAAYRHFGGCPMRDGQRTCNFLEETGTKLEPILDKRQTHDRCPKNVPTVQDLVRQNLEDAHGRHLMLIYSGAADLAFRIVQSAADPLSRTVKVHMGSKFADDRSSDHYALLMLKRIRHSIEHGDVLILHQLDATHGSLYDVLNQNYTLCGKKIGRLALGAVDERVVVHDHFRGIILLEDTALPVTDGAFLNRFEKHRVGPSDVLTEKNIALRDRIIEWVLAASTVRDAATFDEADTFAGWRKEVAAYVALECKEMEVAKRCLRHLATSDGVQRAAKSDWAMSEPMEFEQWRDAGVAWSAFMEQELAQEPRYTVVFTLEKAAPPNLSPSITAMHFDNFSSERDLDRELRRFLSSAPQFDDADRRIRGGAAGLSSASRTLLMCGDADSVNVAFVAHRVKEIVGKEARVILLLHTTRAFLRGDYTGALHFRSGWMPYLIEDFDPPATLDSFDESLKCTFIKLLPEIVPMALWRIKYPSSREAVGYVLRLCDFIPNDPLLVAELLYHCRAHCDACMDTKGWQFAVATSRAIVDSTQGGWRAQVLAFWANIVREPVAKFLYKVEKENALHTLLELDGEKFPKLRVRWFRRCREVVPHLDDVPAPTGPECYTDYTPTVRPL